MDVALSPANLIWHETQHKLFRKQAKAKLSELGERERDLDDVMAGIVHQDAHHTPALSEKCSRSSITVKCSC